MRAVKLEKYYANRYLWYTCREFNLNPNLWETKQIEKTHVKEKQSHAQDNIYVVQQFAYVHGIAGIPL